MTELEKQLLSALEQLQQDYSRRLDEGRAPSRNGGRCLVLCNGERGAERARVGLEQAGAEFERAAAPVIDRLNEIEQQRYGQTTEKEPEKTADLVPERQRTLSHGDREYGD